MKKNILISSIIALGLVNIVSFSLTTSSSPNIKNLLSLNSASAEETGCYKCKAYSDWEDSVDPMGTYWYDWIDCTPSSNGNYYNNYSCSRQLFEDECGEVFTLEDDCGDNFDIVPFD